MICDTGARRECLALVSLDIEYHASILDKVAFLWYLEY